MGSVRTRRMAIRCRLPGWELRLLGCGPAVLIAHSLPSSAQPEQRGLAADPRLGGIGTPDCWNQPISEVAATLGMPVGVPLKCGFGCGDQRATIVAARQPAHQVMELLTRLLAHSPTKTTEYAWTQEAETRDRPTGYALTRTQEAETRDRPTGYALTRTCASRERRLLTGTASQISRP